MSPTAKNWKLHKNIINNGLVKQIVACPHDGIQCSHSLKIVRQFYGTDKELDKIHIYLYIDETKRTSYRIVGIPLT